jgi:stage V sporulation protein AF
VTGVQTCALPILLALAGFTQPSIELGYAIKFMRVLILIGASILGVWGALTAVVINFIVLASTKNIVGMCYLYPLIPFRWDILRHLIFRTRKHEHVKKSRH